MLMGLDADPAVDASTDQTPSPGWEYFSAQLVAVCALKNGAGEAVFTKNGDAQGLVE
jgi:hypothetical protein